MKDIIILIFGWLLGLVSSYFLIIIRNSINEKIIATTKLRNAFAREIATLELTSNNKNDTVSTLKRALVRHKAAVDEFACTLSGDDIANFYEKWIEYYGYKKDGEIFANPYLEKYSHHNDPHGRKKAIDNMKNIIKFATPPRCPKILKIICRL